jgi:hypothetical protein
LHKQTIICKHCGGTRVSKDPTVDHAVVQEVSEETGESIGLPTTFYMFKCLSCGKDVYLEKYETTEKG